MKYFFSIVLLIYVVYTLIYSIRFSIKASHFSGRQKLQHMLLFWLLPFIWTIVVDKQVNLLPNRANPEEGHLISDLIMMRVVFLWTMATSTMPRMRSTGTSEMTDNIFRVAYVVKLHDRNP